MSIANLMAELAELKRKKASLKSNLQSMDQFIEHEQYKQLYQLYDDTKREIHQLEEQIAAAEVGGMSQEGGMSIPEDQVQCIDGSTAPLGQCPPESPASSGSGGSGRRRRSNASGGGDPPTKIILKRGKRGAKVKKWQRTLNVHAINRLNYGVGEHGGVATKNKEQFNHLEAMLKMMPSHTDVGEYKESDFNKSTDGVNTGVQGDWIGPPGAPAGGSGSGPAVGDESEGDLTPGEKAAEAKAAAAETLQCPAGYTKIVEEGIPDPMCVHSQTGEILPPPPPPPPEAVTDLLQESLTIGELDINKIVEKLMEHSAATDWHLEERPAPEGKLLILVKVPGQHLQIMPKKGEGFAFDGLFKKSVVFKANDMAEMLTLAADKIKMYGEAINDSGVNIEGLDLVEESSRVEKYINGFNEFLVKNSYAKLGEPSKTSGVSDFTAEAAAQQATPPDSPTADATGDEAANAEATNAEATEEAETQSTTTSEQISAATESDRIVELGFDGEFNYTHIVVDRGFGGQPLRVGFDAFKDSDPFNRPRTNAFVFYSWKILELLGTRSRDMPWTQFVSFFTYPIPEIKPSDQKKGFLDEVKSIEGEFNNRLVKTSRELQRESKAITNEFKEKISGARESVNEFVGDEVLDQIRTITDQIDGLSFEKLYDVVLNKIGIDTLMSIGIDSITEELGIPDSVDALLAGGLQAFSGKELMSLIINRLPADILNKILLELQIDTLPIDNIVDFIKKGRVPDEFLVGMISQASPYILKKIFGNIQIPTDFISDMIDKYGLPDDVIEMILCQAPIDDVGLVKKLVKNINYYDLPQLIKDDFMSFMPNEMANINQLTDTLDTLYDQYVNFWEDTKNKISTTTGKATEFATGNKFIRKIFNISCSPAPYESLLGGATQWNFSRIVEQFSIDISPENIFGKNAFGKIDYSVLLEGKPAEGGNVAIAPTFTSKMRNDWFFDKFKKVSNDLNPTLDRVIDDADIGKFLSSAGVQVLQGLKEADANSLTELASSLPLDSLMEALPVQDLLSDLSTNELQTLLLNLPDKHLPTEQLLELIESHVDVAEDYAKDLLQTVSDTLGSMGLPDLGLGDYVNNLDLNQLSDSFGESFPPNWKDLPSIDALTLPRLDDLLPVVDYMAMISKAVEKIVEMIIDEIIIGIVKIVLDEVAAAIDKIITFGTDALSELEDTVKAGMDYGTQNINELLESSDLLDDAKAFVNKTVKKFASGDISLDMNGVTGIFDEISNNISSKEMIELLEGRPTKKTKDAINSVAITRKMRTAAGSAGLSFAETVSKGSNRKKGKNPTNVMIDIFSEFGKVVNIEKVKRNARMLSGEGWIKDLGHIVDLDLCAPHPEEDLMNKMLSTKADSNIIADQVEKKRQRRKQRLKALASVLASQRQLQSGKLSKQLSKTAAQIAMTSPAMDFSASQIIDGIYDSPRMFFSATLAEIMTLLTVNTNISVAADPSTWTNPILERIHANIQDLPVKYYDENIDIMNYDFWGSSPAVNIKIPNEGFDYPYSLYRPAAGKHGSISAGNRREFFRYAGMNDTEENMAINQNLEFRAAIAESLMQKIKPNSSFVTQLQSLLPFDLNHRLHVMIVKKVAKIVSKSKLFSPGVLVKLDFKTNDNPDGAAIDDEGGIGAMMATESDSNNSAELFDLTEIKDMVYKRKKQLDSEDPYQSFNLANREGVVRAVVQLALIEATIQAMFVLTEFSFDDALNKSFDEVVHNNIKLRLGGATYELMSADADKIIKERMLSGETFPTNRTPMLEMIKEERDRLAPMLKNVYSAFADKIDFTDSLLRVILEDHTGKTDLKWGVLDVWGKYPLDLWGNYPTRTVFDADDHGNGTLIFEKYVRAVPKTDDEIKAMFGEDFLPTFHRLTQGQGADGGNNISFGGEVLPIDTMADIVQYWTNPAAVPGDFWDHVPLEKHQLTMLYGVNNINLFKKNIKSWVTTSSEQDSVGNMINFLNNITDPDMWLANDGFGSFEAMPKGTMGFIIKPKSGSNKQPLFGDDTVPYHFQQMLNVLFQLGSSLGFSGQAANGQLLISPAATGTGNRFWKWVSTHSPPKSGGNMASFMYRIRPALDVAPDTSLAGVFDPWWMKKNINGYDSEKSTSFSGYNGGWHAKVRNQFFVSIEGGSKENRKRFFEMVKTAHGLSQIPPGEYVGNTVLGKYDLIPIGPLDFEATQKSLSYQNFYKSLKYGLRLSYIAPRAYDVVQGAPHLNEVQLGGTGKGDDTTSFKQILKSFSKDNIKNALKENAFVMGDKFLTPDSPSVEAATGMTFSVPLIEEEIEVTNAPYAVPEFPETQSDEEGEDDPLGAAKDVLDQILGMQGVMNAVISQASKNPAYLKYVNLNGEDFLNPESYPYDVLMSRLIKRKEYKHLFEKKARSMISLITIYTMMSFTANVNKSFYNLMEDSETSLKAIYNGILNSGNYQYSDVDYEAKGGAAGTFKDKAFSFIPRPKDPKLEDDIWGNN